MSIILGLDPGSRQTGIGVISFEKGAFSHIEHKVIKTSGDCLSERLHQIFTGICSTIHNTTPNIMAIEQVFFSKNAQSALKLGQARGAALTAAAHNGIEVTEYSPREIKQAIAGYGNATKHQIQHMVKILLKLTSTPPPDAADALAIAICHCHHGAALAKLSRAKVTAGEGA